MNWKQLIAGGLCAFGLQSGIAGAAERLVTIGSDVTEIVFALGLGEQVVAVDSTSMFPADADALPDLGYMRALAAEPILAMAPDLVMVSEEAGPPQVIEQLQSAGLAIKWITAEPSRAGLTRKIDTISDALDRQAEAKALKAAIDSAFGVVDEKTAALIDPPRAIVLVSVGQGRMLAAGENSSGGRIIEMAGGVNALQGFDGYRPLAAEAAIAAAPDVIVVPSRTLDVMGGADAILSIPQLQNTPAARTGALIAIDSLLLLGFGPRLPEGAKQLADALISHAGIAH